ncbi:hypothetical protein NKJ55_34250 [Mesorhizobium sp. M0106]|uniref:hypothetical protein n=1 Tax=Mesorhizobium sp. M0106 TaxID=2956880 RepID=UPI00333B8CC3
MYDYTSQTPFQVKFNDAEYRFVVDNLRADEIGDEFETDWQTRHVTGVQFWLDTVAEQKGLPCRWHVTA